MAFLIWNWFLIVLFVYLDSIVYVFLYKFISCSYHEKITEMQRDENETIDKKIFKDAP